MYSEFIFAIRLNQENTNAQGYFIFFSYLCI
nr:MAG TPA: hypothetical protein [Caudoviricetes sp.]